MACRLIIAKYIYQQVLCLNAESVWRRMRPEYIQTVCKLGEPVSLGEFNSGEFPSCDFFCFVPLTPVDLDLDAYRVSESDRGYVVELR